VAEHDFRLSTADEIALQLGQRLRAQRLSRSMTQSELSSRADVALSSVKNLESTGRTTLETLVRVTQALALAGELEGLFVLRPSTSIAAMERAELATRQRAPKWKPSL
jgi:transcriptional regulator with XRE-family HTH domain